MTDADRIEYLTNQLRYYKELSGRLHHQLMATKNAPEKDTTRGLHRDPVGNKASARVDRERDKRNRPNGV